MSFVRSLNFLRLLAASLLLTGVWSCKSPAKRNPADITYENGAGRPRTVKLPDGSSVTMSAKTVVRISQKFGQAERDLDLDGEAIFTVNGETGKPFIIHTRNLQIQVLEGGVGQGPASGTLFKVDAYASNAGEEVDVLSGKLKVMKTYHSDTDNEPETIGTGEMVMINRDIDLMEKEKLDSTEWRTLREKVQAMGIPLGANRDSSGSAAGAHGATTGNADSAAGTSGTK